jgi:hypothetical protein
MCGWSALGRSPIRGGVPTGRTLVLRWNGLRWHRVPSPSPGAASQFQGVVTIGGDLWAVGSYVGSGQARTLAARLRDGRWRMFLGPRGSLQAVDATSRDLVWAVGPGKDVAPQRGFVMRWDGTRWMRVLRLGSGSALQDVVVTSPTDAWAVGYRGGTSASLKPAIVRRHGGPWDWARPPHVEGRFWAVDGTPHNVWALRWRSVGDSGFLDTFHRC